MQSSLLGPVTVDTTGLSSFIPEEAIASDLRETVDADAAMIHAIIAKSLGKERLLPRETATLLNVRDPELLQDIFRGAEQLKQAVYGNRIVLFAPLYVGNRCINNCSYCGFRSENSNCQRTTLTEQGLQDEVEALIDHGHKRVIMVYGEHPQYDAEFIAKTVEQVYRVKKGRGEIRRININAAPLDLAGFARVKEAGIGTYQVFQETYHQETYESVHLAGPKSNYLWRLHALDRAMEAGIDDVGIGALMGLYDWRFEVMGLLHHTIHLEERFGVGPHTISFPRIEPAQGSAFADAPPSGVSDADFKHLVAVLRLAVPYTGLILTARESVEMRNEVMRFGVSQMDAGSSIGIGSYAGEDEAEDKSQFELGDTRTLDEVIAELCRANYIPSFCTGCYRLGRTGEHFMEFAVPGFVKRFCQPNALLTFTEYLEDYALPATKKIGLELVEKQLAEMADQAMRERVEQRLQKIYAGARDLFF
nr:[FeFe] hydrogenase H-cluster radical SAM maturase HydG [Desulfotalea psychrophila]